MKELSLFGEKTMTVKEVAEVLGVTAEAIKKHVRVLYPESIQNGIETVLTEEQVTEIKKKMVPTTAVVGSKTDIEENEIVLQAIEILRRKNEELKRRAETAEQQLIEQAPKVEFADSVMGSSDTVDMKEACKVLGLDIGRNRLFQFLRDESILDRNNQPYQRYIDSGYFRIIESRYLLPSGEIKISLKTVVFQRGLNFIKSRYAQRSKAVCA